MVEAATDEAWSEYGPSLLVKVRNRSKSILAFGGDSITATQADMSPRVLDYDGMRVIVEERHQAKQALATIGMIAGAVAGGLAGSGRFNPSTSAALSIGGMTTFQLAAEGLVQSQVDAITESDEIPGSFIGATVLAPGQETGGRLILKDYDASRPLELVIRVGNDVHPVRIRGN